jgi:hypothetical protein
MQKITLQNEHYINYYKVLNDFSERTNYKSLKERFTHTHTKQHVRNDWESQPGDFHPQLLAEPDVNLSTHPAPIV